MSAEVKQGHQIRDLLFLPKAKQPYRLITGVTKIGFGVGMTGGFVAGVLLKDPALTACGSISMAALSGNIVIDSVVNTKNEAHL